MIAKVHIWWFTKAGEGKLDGIKEWVGAGHGALELPPIPARAAQASQLPVPAHVGSRNGSYITWLGDVGAHNMLVNDAWNLNHDREKFQGRPYHMMTIPLADATNVGLDPYGILDWWARRRQKDPKYKMRSKTHNCDATVVRALKAGGAERFASAPVNILYTGAATLRKWVEELNRRIYDLQTTVNDSRALLTRAIPRPWEPNVPVWSVEQWKRESSGGIMAVRREQVAEIDKLLAHYHLFATDATDAIRTHQKLVEILALVIDHLKKKPTSTRRVAVTRLGRQVLDAL